MPVSEQRTIQLNGLLYPIKEPVRVFKASQQPARIQLGQDVAGADQHKSSITWDDWTGGLGVERMDMQKDLTRYWWSTCLTDQRGHLTLGPLANQTAASGVAGNWEVSFINERNGIVYAGFGASVMAYSGVTAWGSVLNTLPASATDSINVRMGGVEYLVIAHTNGYTYFDGTNWTADAKDAMYLAWWDERLWGIDSTGQLWWAHVLGTETDDAQLPRPNSTVTNLFVARMPSGDLGLYVATTDGLYAHNPVNNSLEPTELPLVYHPDNGLGATRWRDSAYISAGMAIFKYVTGDNAAIISDVGLTRNHGVPSARGGRIRALIPTLNHLIALVDATTAPDDLSLMQGGDGYQSGFDSVSEVIESDVGYSWVAGLDGLGAWRTLWESAASTLAITAAHTSNSYGQYRLWWGQNQLVWYMKLPRGITNPDQISDWDYNTASTHELPWIDAGEAFRRKLAIALVLDVKGTSATETVAVQYRINDDDATTTTLGTIIADGHYEYPFPNSTTPTGTAFRTIKPVVALVRGTTTTTTPDVTRLEFLFERLEEVRMGFSVRVEVPEGGFREQSAEQLLENLYTAFRNDALVAFTYRDRDADDAGNANPWDYYVRVMQMTGAEETGHDFSGELVLALLEVYHAR